MMREKKSRNLFLILVFQVPFWAAAQQLPFGFFRNRADKIVFSTTSQSVLAGNCSGVTTIQNQNSAGTAKNVASNLTVNLGALAGVTYYSDMSCLTAVTSITIAAATNAASFYFISTNTGTVTVAGTAAGYQPPSQNETISTNPYVWTGGGGDANWSTALNWSGGVAPSTASHTALFNSTCSSNCSPNITAGISIGGIRMNSGYSGTISQISGSVITLAGSGFVQIAGTFVGTNGGTTMTTNILSLNGGTFTATSGTLNVTSLLSVTGSPTFNHNSGTLVAAPSSYDTWSAVPGTLTYNNFTITGYADIFSFGSGTMTIAGNLSLSESAGITINAGTLLVAGNVSASGGNGIIGGVNISLSGNAAGQTITTTGGTSLPNIIINTGVNPVTLSGTVSLNASYTVTSVGTLTATGSTLLLGCISYSTCNVSPGISNYNGVTFSGYASTFELGGNTMNIGGTLTIASSSASITINSGTLAAAGDLTTSGTASVNGNVVVRLAGNASGQTVATNGGAHIPNLNISAGVNPVTLSGTVNVDGDFNMTSVGTFTVTGSTLNLTSIQYGTSTLNPGTATYNNVSLSGYVGGYTLGNGTMSVAGNLNVASANTFGLNAGTIAVAGNLTSTGAGTGGNLKLTLNGSTAQTITAVSGGTFPTGDVTISTTAGAAINLGSAVNFNDSSQTVTVTAGNINMSGFAFTVKALALGGTTLTKAGGPLTVNGVVAASGALYGGTVAP